MLKLVLYPDPVLEKVAEPVVEFGPELEEFVEQMFEVMHKSNGIGLAAPQVGVSKRIFIMYVQGKRRVVINPKVVSLFGTTAIEEGCLSFPGINVKVSRSSALAVEYFNEKGVLIRDMLDNLSAICFQHELDHLDGKNFIDGLSASAKSYIMKRLEREKKNREQQ